MRKLTLYFHHGCPYCAKVVRYMEEHNIVISMKNIRETSENREELIQIGGKGQVPCLVVDGQAIYESNDIIEWFQNNWKDDNDVR